MAVYRWRVHFPKVVIRLGAVAIFALALQIAAIYAPLGPGDIQRRIMFVVSYLLLVAFVLANLRRPGLLIIGVGLLLNFLAIVTNGGLMPISPANLEKAGLGDQLAELSSGDRVPQSKNVLLAREDTRLWFLTDVLVWKNPTSLSAFSVGDVIIGAGLVITLGELFLPRLQRVSRDRPSLT